MPGHRKFTELRQQLDQRLDALPDERGKQIRERTRRSLQAQLTTPIALSELRQARELTQTDVAAVLGGPQSAVSRTERGEDLHLSTLQRYLHAIGGELEISARFGEERIVLDLPKS